MNGSDSWKSIACRLCMKCDGVNASRTAAAADRPADWNRTLATK
jgi:hypothetical protein